MSLNPQRKQQLISRLPKNLTILGIDPDLHNTAFAYVNQNGVLALGLSQIKKKPHRPSLETAPIQAAALVDALKRAIHGQGPPTKVFIESQFIPPRRAQASAASSYASADPNDLITLATITGTALGFFARYLPASDMVLVLPNRWKGTIDKRIHQLRLLEEIPGLVDALEANEIPSALRSHAIDAAGIAWWGLLQRS